MGRPREYDWSLVEIWIVIFLLGFILSSLKEYV